jgi:hypothetical protein
MSPVVVRHVVRDSSFAAIFLVPKHLQLDPQIVPIFQIAARIALLFCPIVLTVFDHFLLLIFSNFCIFHTKKPQIFATLRSFFCGFPFLNYKKDMPK